MTTTQLTVFASPEADAAGRIGQAIAALPMSLHPGDAGADLVGIAGDAGWTAAAVSAIEAGARGVLVVDPVAEDVSALRERAGDVPVVIDGAWNHNPAVLDSAEPFAAVNDPESLIEARVEAPVGADLERVLLSQLALVRTAVGPVVELTFDRRNAHGYDARGTLEGGARVALAAILTNGLEPSAALRVIKPQNAVRLTVPDAATARPGHVVVSSDQGATLLVTKWESAHRVAWRTLHQLVASGAAGDELAGFADDVEVARAASGA